MEEQKTKEEIVAEIYSLAKDALLLVENDESDEFNRILYGLKDAYEEYRD